MQQTVMCIKCGASFDRDSSEQWKKICILCWKKQNGVPTNAYETRISELESTNLLLRMENNSLQHKMVCNEKVAIFLYENLMDMISLCHPDHHQNSQKATRITQTLLEIRNTYNG